MTPDEIKELYSIFLPWKGTQYKSMRILHDSYGDMNIELYVHEDTSHTTLNSFVEAKEFMLHGTTTEEWKKYLQETIESYTKLLENINDD